MYMGYTYCPLRLVVRTLLFQGSNTGSNPVGDAKNTRKAGIYQW